MTGHSWRRAGLLLLPVLAAAALTLAGTASAAPQRATSGVCHSADGSRVVFQGDKVMATARVSLPVS
jgi:hypothetical protein